MRYPFHFGLVAVAYAAPQVKIGKTTLFGRDVTGLKQDFFGGIPYAEPPLGDLRLKFPVLKTELDSPSFDASNFGPSCLQPGLPVPLLSEDCLTINVFRPSNLLPDAKLPVFFWTHGGGFLYGSSTEYNASLIVARSVARGTPLICVSFNYRLGPLGYPQGKEAAHQRSLNLGLRDQIAALEWVQHNIDAFGGDKNKVTIAGESAGAIMISILYLNSPLDKLVRGAILESGSQATSTNFYPKRREGNWENFVAGVESCASTATSGHTFDCLRTANELEIYSGIMNSIKKSPEVFPFFPTIDGPGGLYPDVPSRLFSRGKFARVPFISGTNLDEGTMFVPPKINSEEEIRQYIIANYSPPIVPPAELDRAVDKLLQLYPDIPALGSPFNTGDETFHLPSSFKRISALVGDLWFQSQRRFWQQTATKAGVKSWGYLFTHSDPFLHPPFLGVAHSDEVTYVYGVPNDPSPSSHSLSKVMMDYWISFATSLDPNDGKGDERPLWEQYASDNERLIQFDGDGIKMIDDSFRKAQMDYINSIPLVFLH
ncbi:CAZyme family CE10 [Agaricus bisporus var. burnettii]|uniref:Carboxylic ester hydrolase n=1 Tax=Agaricus bisporus var. burnettii TaxID=192524 RepID=A0A8H7C5P6_AGABI|nr:CAZyme family CE10 [Agaricus bisporus var. burnettii]